MSDFQRMKYYQQIKIKIFLMIFLIIIKFLKTIKKKSLELCLIKNYN